MSKSNKSSGGPIRSRKPRKKVGLMCVTCGRGPYFGAMALEQHRRDAHIHDLDGLISAVNRPAELDADETPPDSPT